MTDFEKILEVTRMATRYGDYLRKTRIKDVPDGIMFIAKGLMEITKDFKRINVLFPNNKQRALVMNWHHTVYEMRST